MSSGSNSETPVVVGLGEVLWDVFSDGPRFGGAPANFACSAAGLASNAAEVYIVSAIGADKLGDRAIEQIAKHGVNASCIQRREQPTGTVSVSVDADGRATYEFAADTAWDNLAWSDHLQQLADQTSAVCFGTLGQRGRASREVIRRFVDGTPENCLRILDVNLRPPFWTETALIESLSLANVVKCNEEELPVLASLAGCRGRTRRN